MDKYFVIFSHIDNRAVVTFDKKVIFDKTISDDPLLNEQAGAIEIKPLPSSYTEYPLSLIIEGYNGAYGEAYRGGGHTRDASQFRLVYKIIKRVFSISGEVINENIIFNVNVQLTDAEANKKIHTKVYKILMDSVSQNISIIVDNKIEVIE